MDFVLPARTADAAWGIFRAQDDNVAFLQAVHNFCVSSVTDAGLHTHRLRRLFAGRIGDRYVNGPHRRLLAALSTTTTTAAPAAKPATTTATAARAFVRRRSEIIHGSWCGWPPGFSSPRSRMSRTRRINSSGGSLPVSGGSALAVSTALVSAAFAGDALVEVVEGALVAGAASVR